MSSLNLRTAGLAAAGLATAAVGVGAGFLIGKPDRPVTPVAATREAPVTIVRTETATPSTVTLPAPPPSTVTLPPSTITRQPPTTGAGGLKTKIADGTFLVGTDMEAGTYKTDGGGSLCYWARLKDDAGHNIIANDLTEGGPTRFTANKGEYVKVSNCTFSKTK